jgi:hypothetical protein
VKKTNWKYRLLIWWAQKVLHVPFIVNFTPEDHEDLYAVAFAWSPQAAERVRGNDMLIERLKAAQTAAKAASGTRTGRRLINRAARRAAQKELAK